MFMWQLARSAKQHSDLRSENIKLITFYLLGRFDLVKTFITINNKICRLFHYNMYIPRSYLYQDRPGRAILRYLCKCFH